MKYRYNHKKTNWGKLSLMVASLALGVLLGAVIAHKVIIHQIDNSERLNRATWLESSVLPPQDMLLASLPIHPEATSHAEVLQHAQGYRYYQATLWGENLQRGTQ